MGSSGNSIFKRSGTDEYGGMPSAAGSDNKFNVGGTWGDTDPTFSANDMNDNKADFAQDSAGLPASSIGNNKTDMDMALKPNMFPRQTGHDSLTEEEAYLS